MSYTQSLSKSDLKWLDIIQECRTSGKSDNQWLEEHNIKSPTFYYHVKKLRQKACEIPNQKQERKDDVQAVVPLLIEETTPITAPGVSGEPISITHSTSNNDTIAIHLTLHGVEVEITNNATQEIIQNTLAALRFLC